MFEKKRERARRYERGNNEEGDGERGGLRDKQRSRSESFFNADCNAERRFEA